jgi:hypothetical protein
MENSVVNWSSFRAYNSSPSWVLDDGIWWRYIHVTNNTWKAWEYGSQVEIASHTVYKYRLLDAACPQEIECSRPLMSSIITCPFSQRKHHNIACKQWNPLYLEYTLLILASSDWKATLLRICCFWHTMPLRSKTVTARWLVAGNVRNSISPCLCLD